MTLTHGSNVGGARGAPLYVLQFGYKRARLPRTSCRLAGLVRVSHDSTPLAPIEPGVRPFSVVMRLFVLLNHEIASGVLQGIEDDGQSIQRECQDSEGLDNAII